MWPDRTPRAIGRARGFLRDTLRTGLRLWRRRKQQRQFSSPAPTTEQRDPPRRHECDDRVDRHPHDGSKYGYPNADRRQSFAGGADAVGACD